MAEAVVEERAAVSKRYYCHMCNVEIDIPNTEFTCPLCAGGFVEELPPVPTTASTSANNGGPNVRSTQPGATSMFDLRDLQRGSLADIDALRGEIATLLMSRNGENVEISLDPGLGRGNFVALAAPSASQHSNSSNTAGANNGGAGIGTAGGRVRAATLESLDQILMDFLHSLSGGDPIGGNPYNSPMFFMGNPGDYAWGREGIDTIVTQLLNQMETSGPPPLSKEKINEISTVPVSNEEIERKLQCSVCWEDFQLDEMVRKLPCSHMYHENCIVPWLKLHGTCPICRKSLDENADDCENAENDSTDIEMNESSLNNDTPGGGGGSEGGGRSAIGVNPNTTTSQQRMQPRQTNNSRPNNVFNFEDDRNLPLD